MIDDKDDRTFSRWYKSTDSKNKISHFRFSMPSFPMLPCNIPPIYTPNEVDIEKLDRDLQANKSKKWYDSFFEVPDPLPNLPFDFFTSDSIPKNTIIAIDPGSKDSHGLFKLIGDEFMPVDCTCKHCEENRTRSKNTRRNIKCKFFDLSRKIQCGSIAEEKGYCSVHFKEFLFNFPSENQSENKDRKPMPDLAIKTLESKLDDLEASLKNEKNILSQREERIQESKNNIQKIQANCQDVRTSLEILCAVHNRESALNEPPEASLPDGSMPGDDSIDQNYNGF